MESIEVVSDPAEAHGFAGLVDSVAAAFESEWSDEPFPEGAARRFLEERWEDPETLLLVARGAAPERPSGLMLTGALEDPLSRRRTPVVLALWVDPGARHRGVATRLVARARELLAARGFTGLAARAGHNDDALISMGERWGFVRIWELLLHE